MQKPVVVLVGSGSIGQAIARRTGAGKKVLLADLRHAAAEAAARTFTDAGFDAEPVQCDLGSRESILSLVERARSFGQVHGVVNAAGVSPSQAPVAEILRVDLYGTSVLLEEFGKVIAEGGSGLVVSTAVRHIKDAVSSLDIKLDPEEIAALEEPCVPHIKTGAF